jgi:hypothetical protein
MSWSFRILAASTVGLLVAGCDLISQVGQDFQTPATVEVTGAFEGACVRLNVLRDGAAVGNWSMCSAPFRFRLPVPDGPYTLNAQAGQDGLVYQEANVRVTLRRGQQVSLSLRRRTVQVEVTAPWLATDRPGLAEVWMKPEEVRGAATYADTPPAGLEGRVLVGREVIAEGRARLRSPTGRDVAVRVVQGEQSGMVRVSRIEADSRVVVP